ncbi:MAG TPA: single-stranded DNA-binding protein [Capillibacterium sp.]
MNHVILIGRLTRDPELRYTPNGVAVATFTVAVDRPYTSQSGERETDFIPVVVWQKLAETCANHLHKGRLVAVDGRLQIRNYETQDGQKRRVAEVVAANVQFLDRAGEARRPAPAGEGGGVPAEDQAADDFGEINLDDLPF